MKREYNNTNKSQVSPLAVIAYNDSTKSSKHINQLDSKKTNIFTAGELAIADINLFNTNDYATPYEVEMFVSTNKEGSDVISSSGSAVINVEPKSSVFIRFSFNMPVDERQYCILLDIKVDSNRIELKKICDVVVKNAIVKPPSVGVEFIGWEENK